MSVPFEDHGYREFCSVCEARLSQSERYHWTDLCFTHGPLRGCGKFNQ